MALIVSWGETEEKQFYSLVRCLSMMAIKHFLLSFKIIFSGWTNEATELLIMLCNQNSLLKKMNCYYIPLWTITCSKSAVNHQFTCFTCLLWGKSLYFQGWLLIPEYCFLNKTCGKETASVSSFVPVSSLRSWSEKKNKNAHVAFIVTKWSSFKILEQILWWSWE